jgi:hypothetical protein
MMGHTRNEDIREGIIITGINIILKTIEITG